MDPSSMVDARGRACPEPALMTRRALAGRVEGVVEVLVDSAVARDNVVRVATQAGWRATVEALGQGEHRIRIER